MLSNEELELKQVKLQHLYHECLAEEREIFDALYGGVSEVTESKIDWVIQQCENTLKLPHHINRKKIKERKDKLDNLLL